MKLMLPNKYSCACILFFLIASGCGEDEVSESQRVTELLTAGTWSVQTVTVDGSDRSALFTGLALNFSETGFTTTNGGLVWAGSGSWIFTTEDASAFRRNDDVVVSIDEITDNRLVLGLSWAKNTFSPGRVTSVSGQHVFVLKRS